MSQYMFIPVIKKITIILSCLLVLGFCITGLSAASPDDTVLATVNGVDIKKTQLDRTITEYKKRAKQDNISNKEKKKLLKNLIRRQLILTDKAAQALKKEPQIVELLKRFEDDLIVTRFLKINVEKQLKVSDDEIKEYYNKNRYKFEIPPKVEARHILLRSKKEAEKTLADLKNGVDFIQLAKERSIDLPMALEGGQMGSIERGKSLPDIEDILFTLEPGKFSQILKTRFGFHILRVDKIIPQSFKPLEKVKKEIKRTLLRKKKIKAFNEMTSRLEKEADIQIYKECL